MAKVINDRDAATLRRLPAFTVSTAARDNPLVRDMYDDEDDEDDGRGESSQISPGRPSWDEPTPGPSAPRNLRDRFAEFQGDASCTLEPAFGEGAAQRFRKEPAGGLHRPRPPHVLDSISGSFLDRGPALDAIPSIDGVQVEGLASIGVVLMQAQGQGVVVAELTPKGREMADVSKYVRSGDRVLEVDGQAVPWSLPVAEVEKLLVGAPGSATNVRLLRPFPASDTFARREMCNRKPENEECAEGVMYYINTVRWCPFLGHGSGWGDADKARILKS